MNTARQQATLLLGDLRNLARRRPERDIQSENVALDIIEKSLRDYADAQAATVIQKHIKDNPSML